MKINRLYVLCVLLCSVLTIQGQSVLEGTVQKLKSPNGAYEFAFYQKHNNAGEKQMYYTLSFKGKKVVEESELGVLIENQTFESALGIPNDTCKVWGESEFYRRST